MINPKQVRDSVVIPALKKLGCWSQDAENLVMGTIWHESDKFSAIRQYGTGPARGMLQMEPATYNDIWNNWLKFQTEPRSVLVAHLGARNGLEALETDLIYGAMMCRVHYRRIREALPVDLDGYAAYWKKYYNTVHGKGTEDEFKTHYVELRTHYVELQTHLD
jgi:hypothetical protein